MSWNLWLPDSEQHLRELLDVLLKSNLRRRLVRVALDRELPAEARREVQARLSRIRFRGRRPGKLPDPATLESILIQDLHKMHSTVVVLLDAWRKAMPELTRDVEAALGSVEDERNKALRALRGADALRSKAQEISGGTSASLDDVTLTLLSLVLSLARSAPVDGPASQEEVVQTDPDSDAGAEPPDAGAEPPDIAASTIGCVEDRWDALLADLEAMPCDAPEWSRVATFLESAGSILRQKAEEREAPRRKLTELLTDLTAFQEELEYLELSDHEQWSAHGAPVGALVIACAQVGDLMTSLKRHHELRTQRVSRRSEDVQRLEAQQREENKIQVFFRELNALLSPISHEAASESAGREVSGKDAKAATEDSAAPTSVTLVSTPLPLEIAALSRAMVPSVPAAEPALPDVRVPRVEPAESEGATGDTHDTEPAPLPERAEPPREHGALQEVLAPAAAPAIAESELAASEPSPTPSEPTPAPPPAPVEPSSLSRSPVAAAGPAPSRLPDAELAARIAQHIDASDPVDLCGPLLVEQQLRWLLHRESFRAYVLASHAEEAPASVAGLLPSWLCWLAVLIEEPGFIPVEPSIPDLIPKLVQVDRCEPEEQRFLVAWLSAGLLSAEPGRAIELAQNLPREVLDFAWLEDSPFYGFCMDHLVTPAQQKRRPQLRTQEPAEVVLARFRREIEAARTILTLASAYKNTDIRRYWERVRRRDGPVHALIQQVEKGAADVPSAEELAAMIDGWDEIVADYRHNLLTRIETVTDHLSRAIAIRAILTSRDRTQETTLPADRVARAIQAGDEETQALIKQRQPSAAGFRLVFERLRAAFPQEASRT